MSKFFPEVEHTKVGHAKRYRRCGSLTAVLREMTRDERALFLIKYAHLHRRKQAVKAAKSAESV